MKQVIAIHGKMHSGKSTAAKYMQKRTRAVVRPFAKPIKDFATLLGWNGNKDKKGRRLLQLLGTEVGRECISDLIWVYKWQVDLGDEDTVICDDLRFQNEYDFLADLEIPVVLIHIIRPTDMTCWQRLVAWLCTPWIHVSERGIKFDDRLRPIEIHNTGTVSQLHFEIDRLIHELL